MGIVSNDIDANLASGMATVFGIEDLKLGSGREVQALRPQTGSPDPQSSAEDRPSTSGLALSAARPEEDIKAATTAAKTEDLCLPMS